MGLDLPAIWVAAILLPMIVAIFALAGFQGSPSIESIDAMAKRRDVAGLSKLLLPLPVGEVNPLGVLSSGGAYDTGRAGWSAAELNSPSGQEQFVVLSTAMTSEDVAQIVLRRFGPKLSLQPEDDAQGIQILRHDFDLVFEPAQRKAVLVDRMSLESRSGSGPFIFRMSPQYIVRSIENETGAAVPFEESSGVVIAARPTNRATYTIRYDAIVNQPGYAGSISQTEATLTNDYWYPLVARQPAPYDITVHSPKGWTAVAQGELVSESESADGRTTKYRMDLPTVYFSVSAAPYRIVSQVIDGRRLSVWSLRMSEEDMRSQTELYAPILRFYERFSPFPFTGYGAVDSAVYGGGALEAYSFATYGGGLPYEDAHEPSHTWWGGIVPNTYLHSFWNESFADYSDGLYHREAPIGNSQERSLAFIQDGQAEDSYNSASVSHAGVYSGSVAGGLGYGKGAQVLQMLEQEIGTDKMIQAMHRWIADTPHGIAGEWVGFEKAAEEVAPDAHLESFFRDWLDRPGFPKLSVSDVRYDNGLHLTVGFDGPVYRTPLDVLCQLEDGSRQFLRIDAGARGMQNESFTLKPRAKPALLSVDPWRRALRRIEADERPPMLSSSLAEMPRYTDPAHSDYLRRVGGNPVTQLPAQLKDVFIVGHPDTLPELKPLLVKVGFVVHGNTLTYDGTSIDLDHGAALALVDTPDGRVAIGLGKTRVLPDTGRARLALVDDLGRFLRGVTEPKTSGHLTFRL